MIKPAIYLAALSQPDKFNVLTTLEDKQVKIKLGDGDYWAPNNYDAKTHGRVPLYLALSKSLNLATVDLGLKTGYARIREILKDLGIEQAIPEYPSLFLGALDLSPLDVTQMYQTIANDGFKIPLKSIREVLDQDGTPLKRYDLEISQTIDPKYVYLIKYLLTRVINEGTASSVRMTLSDKLPLAGKTGTTNDLRDSWFAGYGDNLVAVVWLGRDDNKPAGLTGARGALVVWSDLMQKVNITPLNMLSPEGIEWINIYQDMRSTGNCGQTTAYPFIIPYGPVREINCNNRGAVKSYFQ